MSGIFHYVTYIDTQERRRGVLTQQRTRWNKRYIYTFGQYYGKTGMFIVLIFNPVALECNVDFVRKGRGLCGGRGRTSSFLRRRHTGTVQQRKREKKISICNFLKCSECFRCVSMLYVLRKVPIVLHEGKFFSRAKFYTIIKTLCVFGGRANFANAMVLIGGVQFSRVQSSSKQGCDINESSKASICCKIN